MPSPSPIPTVEPSELHAILEAVLELRADALEREREFAESLAIVAPAQLPSAKNLVHYLALRRHDLRALQDELAARGLSSLGRAEAGVLPTLDAVIELLRASVEHTPLPAAARIDLQDARRRLEAHTAVLLGPPPADRPSRVMVTAPTEAATQFVLVRNLLAAGMDVFRINAAHDDLGQWEAMVEHLRRAEREVGRRCRVQVDLPGPKLRTGAVADSIAVRRFRPMRDELGRVLEPARMRIGPSRNTADVPLPRRFVDDLRVGDELQLRDARGRKRIWRIIGADGVTRRVICDRTTYVTPGTRIELWRTGRLVRDAAVGLFEGMEVPLLLRGGDHLWLAKAHQGDPHVERPSIGCLEPSALDRVEVGHRILFDDGTIAGIVREVADHGLDVEITMAPPDGGKLRRDRGINLPDTPIDGPGLSDRDLAALDFAAARADLVGLSFVQSAEEVGRVRRELVERNRPDLGIVLKIETRRAFENLPALLLSALAHMPAGVMMARGDLGVELGFERLAEVQEEILWLCEAAHVPVIWATQVLETMARTGQPSRAEVTDAAMSGRAECVMLNKGPFVLDTLRFLIGVLCRMQSHQSKKRTLLRRLAVSG